MKEGDRSLPIDISGPADWILAAVMMDMAAGNRCERPVYDTSKSGRRGC